MKMQTISKLSSIQGFFLFLAFSIVIMFIIQDATASAQVRDGIEATGAPPAGVSVEGVIQAAVDIFSWVVGVISVIMIIVGGLKYITSTGDAGKVDSAKNTILYAVVGLVVVVLAQVIVLYVLNQTTTSPGPGEDSSSLPQSSVVVNNFDVVSRIEYK